MGEGEAARGSVVCIGPRVSSLCSAGFGVAVRCGIGVVVVLMGLMLVVRVLVLLMVPIMVMVVGVLKVVIIANLLEDLRLSHHELGDVAIFEAEADQKGRDLEEQEVGPGVVRLGAAPKQRQDFGDKQLHFAAIIGVFTEQQLLDALQIRSVFVAPFELLSNAAIQIIEHRLGEGPVIETPKGHHLTAVRGERTRICGPTPLPQQPVHHVLVRHHFPRLIHCQMPRGRRRQTTLHRLQLWRQRALSALLFAERRQRRLFLHQPIVRRPRRQRVRQRRHRPLRRQRLRLRVIVIIEPALSVLALR